MSEMRLVVVGAAGRMGRMLVAAISQTRECRLVGAIERSGASDIGQDAGLLAGVGPIGLGVTDDPAQAFARADGVLDFTSPSATASFALLAAQAKIVHVVGTTGLDDADFARLRAAAQQTRIVQSGNMSLGVNVLAGLVRKAAEILGDEFDIEIVETHHRRKVDAPSGTALMLGEAAAKGRQIALRDRSVRGRDGITGPREIGTVGFASLRGGTVVGDHTVTFAGTGERIELTHRAEDRSLFAHGAIKAALWAFDKRPGYYTMADVLGF